MRLRLDSKVLVQMTDVLSVRYYISNSFRIREQGPLATRTATRRTTVQKNHIPDLLFTSLCVSWRFCFLRLKPCELKAIKCFSVKLNKYQKLICCYILAVLRTPKKVFSRSNFSNNSVQVPSPMHSNVQLLYLLLFFAVGVGVAVLVAKGP